VYVTDYKRLRALAVDTGEVLWEQSSPSFRGEYVSVRDDRLFLSGHSVTAVNATTGEVRWESSAPIRPVRAAVGTRRLFVPTLNFEATGPRLFTYDHTDSTPIACAQLSGFLHDSDVVTDDELRISAGVFENPETTFIQARRPDGSLAWRIVRDGQWSVRMCAGRDALFLRYGSTLEAVALS
jgi:hypothetical protein